MENPANKDAEHNETRLFMFSVCKDVLFLIPLSTLIKMELKFDLLSKRKL